MSYFPSIETEVLLILAETGINRPEPETEDVPSVHIRIEKRPDNA